MALLVNGSFVSEKLGSMSILRLLTDTKQAEKEQRFAQV